MKIYTLEAKGEVLSILTHKDNISYRSFKDICTKVSQEVDNDFYSLKDVLVDEYKFEIVEASGGFECMKKKGAI